MAIRNIVQIGDPRLRIVNADVADPGSEEIKSVIADLVDTMRAENLIGLAAPQLGINLRIFVTEPRPTPSRSVDQSDFLRVYINPTLVTSSDEQVVFYEGCGSIAAGMLFGPVERARQITIAATDVDGRRIRLETDGILARVILHEHDHLLGELFTDKLQDPKKLLSRDAYVEQIRDSIEQKKNGQITVKNLQYLD